MARNLIDREPRFAIEKRTIAVARPYGMHYSFELNVKNVGESSILLFKNPPPFIPFQLKDKLNLTFDFYCSYFERPIHMVVVVSRVDRTKELQQFGVVILSIDLNHKQIFLGDLNNLLRV